MNDEPSDPPDAEPTPTNPRAIVWAAILFEGGLIGVAWLLGWWLGPLPLRTFHWDALEAAWGLAAVVPMLALFFACLYVPFPPLQRIKQFCEDVLFPLLGPCTLLDLAGISVLAGLGEEMLFRGVLQPAATSWFGNPWVGLAVASALFGLCHAITLTYALLAMLMGFYLGWVWMYSDNLLVVIVAHAGYDFIALVLLLRVFRPANEGS